MTAVLGISAFYHDAAAALVVDGQICAAAQEERFSRVKHDPSFPEQAVAHCLAAGGLSPADLDYVAFYDKPYLKFGRLLETYLAYAPAGFLSFAQALPVWLNEKLHLPGELRKHLPGYDRRFVFTEHHEAHAASAFYPSPFEEAAVLTLDGVGEWATASLGHGKGHELSLSAELRFPHSLGLLYSAFTTFCGFRVNSGEYKLMGLAPYGRPRYAPVIREVLMDLKPDGSFRLDLSYFNYCQGLTMTSPKMERLLGGPPRQPEAKLTQREMDLAASIQQVTEEVMLRCARHLHDETGLANLCLAGGVALNCVGNGRILREGPFDRVWIQPASGDAGGALGAALFVWHQILGEERRPQQPDGQGGSLLGPSYSDEDIAELLAAEGAVFRRFDDDGELCATVAALLADEQVVGWFQGAMEFGPRALGCRSILGDARSDAMQSTMNLKIKFRESFRPFAPVVLQERASEYFDLPADVDSPYMLLVTPVAADKRVAPDDDEAAIARGLALLHRRRSEIPAVTHVDGSARVQTVDAARHGRFHQLLRAFADQTGCPVLINTSFNVRGEPIVRSPAEAYRCFMATQMDALVLEHHLLLKADQPDAEDHPIEDYLDQFALD